MDICHSFLDACSLIEFAPCPPPDIDANTFYDHLSERNMTMQVMLHIAVRCGITAMPPTSTDRTPLLIIVCLVLILSVIIIIIIVLRRISFHRSNKDGQSDSLNSQERATFLTKKTNIADNIPMDTFLKKDKAETKADGHTRIC